MSASTSCGYTASVETVITTSRKTRHHCLSPQMRNAWDGESLSGYPYNFMVYVADLLIFVMYRPDEPASVGHSIHWAHSFPLANWFDPGEYGLCRLDLFSDAECATKPDWISPVCLHSPS